MSDNISSVRSGHISSILFASFLFVNHYIKFYRLTICKRSESLRLDLCLVNEHIFRTIIGRNEAESLYWVKELDSSCGHIGHSECEWLRSGHSLSELGRRRFGKEE